MKTKILLLFLLPLILAADETPESQTDKILAWNPGLAQVSIDPTQTGRFTIVVGPDGPLRIDTVTGRTWQLVSIEKPAHGKAWVPCLEFGEVQQKLK